MGRTWAGNAPAGIKSLLRSAPRIDEHAAALPDTLREAGEHALGAVRRWSDPRERELRKRRRVRRRSVRLGITSGVAAAGVVGLALVSAPAWALVVLVIGAIGLLVGTASSTRRYVRLRRAPLPRAAYRPRKLPASRSVARAPMSRLARAERALHELGEQLGGSRRLPEDELTDLLDTAASGAAALDALATDIVAMERTVGAVGGSNPDAAADLTQNMHAALDRLETGIIDYEQTVAAAGRILAVPADVVVQHEFDMVVADLRDAADRLDSWAQALSELAENPGTLPQQEAAGPMTADRSAHRTVG